MSIWKIQWYYANGNKAPKKKLYESERMFETYWKYHAEYVDYFNDLELTGYIVGTKDGVEIRRHPRS
jgi:hypothetical protein